MRAISWKEKNKEYRKALKKLMSLVADPENVKQELVKRIPEIFRKDVVVGYLPHVAAVCRGWNNGQKLTIESVINIHIGDCAEHNHRERMR